MKSLVALLVFVIVTVQAEQLTKSQVQAIRDAIREMINADAIENGNPQNLRMLGGLLRLSFHDCVSDQCDGCINLNNHHNDGLEGYIDRAELLYNNQSHGISDLMSRADFWALCGIEAVAYAIDLDTCRRCPRVEPPITFRTGRKDCETSPSTDKVHEFPGPFLNNKELVAFFRDKFGFNHKQTVAIMGAHTLGRAHREASGFNHPWVNRQDRFNNAFYKDLLNGGPEGKDFINTFVGGRAENKWLWESSKGIPVTMMLTADMSLVRDLPIEETGQVLCSYETCPINGIKTYDHVVTFANDNQAFINQFSNAFEIMIEHGYGDAANPLEDVLD